MSKLVMRIAALAAVGVVALSVSAGDAEARRGGGGGGRGGPGLSSGIGRGGPALGALRGPGFAHRSPGFAQRLTIRPGRPLWHHGHRWHGHRWHYGHRWHRHRFVFGGGVYDPGCGVIWRRRFDPATGLFYRVRSYTCAYGYGYGYNGY